jgi:hypothetical protein
MKKLLVVGVIFLLISTGISISGVDNEQSIHLISSGKTFTNTAEEDNLNNSNCFIVGITTSESLVGFSERSLYFRFLVWLKENYPTFYLLFVPIGLILTIPYLMWVMINYLFPNTYPLCFNSSVYFGGKGYGGFGVIDYINCSGRIWTSGDNGVKTWDGPFYGNISVYNESFGLFYLLWCKGISGFKGVKITVNRGSRYTLDYLFLGYAKQVSLCKEYPFDNQTSI